MGIKYKMVQSTRKEIKSATCDRCSEKLEISGPGQWNMYGRPHSLYHETCIIDSHFILNQVWGYPSKKDGQIDRVVLCEACYDEVLKEITIENIGS